MAQKRPSMKDYIFNDCDVCINADDVGPLHKHLTASGGTDTMQN